MRSLEIACLLVNVPLLAWCLSRRPVAAWARVLPAAALLVMALLLPGSLSALYAEVEIDRFLKERD
jgi:hypothetical protein